MKRVGLALGGGGAKGLAHIPMLEAFDELGVRPHCIAGTSMGAVFGALYASGASGSDIRKEMGRLSITERDSFAKLIFNRDISKWIDFIDPEFGRSFTVVRLTEDRIRALPWRWDFRDWDRQQRWGNSAIPEEKQRFRMDARL